MNSFFPQHYPILDTFTFFGIALFICHTAGELLFKTALLPRISSYLLTGFLLGPHGLNIVNKSLIQEMDFVTDISVGLVLFMIGQHLDLKWLKNDKGLLFTCIAEFILSLCLVFCLLAFMGWDSLYSLLAAIIICTISPSILLLITQDLNAEGPISRRALIITSVNNFLALSLFTLLYPYLENLHSNFIISLLHALYCFLASIFLGGFLFKVLEFLARNIFPKKHREQFILLISLLILALSTAHYLKLSAFLTLISMGIATRNLDKQHSILEFNLNAYTHIFFIPLFFITGCYLDFKGFLVAPFLLLGCIFIRILTKTISVFAFQKKSFLTNSQSLCIGSALMPLSGFALGMTSQLDQYLSRTGMDLASLVSTCIGFLGLVGPIVLQYVLLKNNEGFESLRKV